MSARRRASSGHVGYLVLDKPAGITSHDVVAAVRRVFGERRVGHGGTLDPPATGVLVVGVGSATRLLRFCSDLDKTYTGEFVLGSTTDTLDATGRTVATFDMSAVTADQVVEAATRVVGDIEQIPPMVSSVQVDGKRLHELARAGIEIDRKARPVRVMRFDVEQVEALSYRFVIECSSGTYVRSLCADLGSALGGGAHLKSLRRTTIGAHRIEDAHPLAGLTIDALLPARGLVSHLPNVTIDDATLAQVRHGQLLSRAASGLHGDGPWTLIDPTGEVCAIYECYGPTGAKPTLVLSSGELDSDD